MITEDKLYWYKAKVMRVIDGDTVEVEVDHGMRLYSRQHLRLADIDAPEVYGVKKDSETYQNGLAAKARLAEILSSVPYVMVNTRKDRTSFNRYVADVYVRLPDNHFDTNVADLLLLEGLVTKA
jgi:micrococcal nuclease